MDNVHGSLLPLSIIIDLYKNSECLINMLQKLQLITYVGGTLPKEIGDPILSRVELITLIGSTETMLLLIELDTNPADW